MSGDCWTVTVHRREASRVWRVRQRIFNVEFAQHAPSNSQRRETSPVSRLRQTLHRLVESLLPPYDSHQGIRPLLFQPKFLSSFFLFSFIFKNAVTMGIAVRFFWWISSFFVSFFVWPYQLVWILNGARILQPEPIGFLSIRKNHFPTHSSSPVYFSFILFYFIFLRYQNEMRSARIPHKRYLYKESWEQIHFHIKTVCWKDKRMSFFLLLQSIAKRQEQSGSQRGRPP